MTATAWQAIALGAFVTWLARMSFLAFASKAAALSPAVRDVLRMIPPAALAAFVLPRLVWQDTGDALVFDPVDVRLLIGALAVWVTWRFNSVIATVALGVGGVYVLELLLAA